VRFELRVEKIHLTTEAQRPQRGAIFLCLSRDTDKHKSLSLYEATDIYCMPIQKAHAYINVQNIPEGAKSFYLVVLSRPDKKHSPLCSLCLRGEKLVS
jgi:hypothetical protein